MDWVALNLYWTDEMVKTVTVAKLDNPAMRRTLIRGFVQDIMLVNPRAIVVLPIRGCVLLKGNNEHLFSSCILYSRVLQPLS